MRSKAFKFLRLTGIIILVAVAIFVTAIYAGKYVWASSQSRPIENQLRNLAPLSERLQENELKLGDTVFIRIFKEENILELWIKPEGHEQCILFHTYTICYYSGALGPKTAQGDRQAPEGFYAFGLNRLNPNSNYYKAFNLGYPNAYDRSMGYTGDYLMVHGNCVSVGCYAMTDAQIDEIYTLAEAALKQGQPFIRVHIFPFRRTAQNLARYENHRWYDFWRMLAPGYDAFEQSHIPPDIEVVNRHYVVCQPTMSCR